MTSEEIIQAIRNEIEKQIKDPQEYCYGVSSINKLRELLDFIDTLESGKPVPNDLEEYASRAGFDYVDDIEVNEPGHRWNDHDVEYAYRDGIIAGAKWQADQTPLPEDTALFNKGVEEGKRLMMEEWLKDRGGCFWDGVNEGKKAKDDAILAIIESRISEIIGDAQPKPVLRAELQEIIKRIKNEK